jgi:hypothetical protein
VPGHLFPSIDRNIGAIKALADGQPTNAIPKIAVQPVPKEFTQPLLGGKGAVQNVQTRGLGRVKPVAFYDYGNYKAVKGQDGKTRYFPRMGAHLDYSKLAGKLPDSVDWSQKAQNVVKRMYLNDQYGDCVWASRYHQAGFMTGSDTGVGLEGTDPEVFSAYQSACGRGDNGCDMSVVNQYQMNVGWKMNGVLHKTRGSVSVDHTNKTMVMAAIYIFGGLNCGLSLPNQWYQSANGATWDITSTGIVGDHEVQAFGYNATGVLISTWAGTRTVTWAAFMDRRWFDEVYATRSVDWYGNDNVAPNGIDVAGLDAAFAAIQGGQVPPLPDPDPPTPPTPPTPGKGYTGTITVTTTYANGVPVGQPVTSLGGSTPAASVEADLKSAGVNPAVIVDVLKLLADVRAKAGKAVILADVLQLISDIGGIADTPPIPAPMLPECSSKYLRRDVDALVSREWDICEWCISV